MNIADLLTNKLTALDKAVTTVSEQFLCSNHNATDMQLILLELVQSNCDSVQEAREA